MTSINPPGPNGWGTDTLDYTLMHETWFGPAAGYHHPALHLARVGADAERVLWEMEVTEHLFPARRGAPDMTGVKLHLYAEDTPALVTDLPPEFWDGVRTLNTVAELAALLASIGGRDTTERRRPARSVLAEAAPR